MPKINLQLTNHNQQQLNSRGFTLIELLVVISIIGMTSSVVLASVKTARQKAITTSSQEIVRQYDIALQSYYNSYGGYPSKTTTEQYACMGNYATNGCTFWGTVINPDSNVTAALRSELPSLPQLPTVQGTNGPIYLAACSSGVCQGGTVYWMLKGNVSCGISGSSFFLTGGDTYCYKLY